MSLYLFADNNEGTAENLGSYRLYNMKIDGDDPRDFQPVLDSNGVPCLMDKINKKYYYDKNGNLFGCDGYSEYKRVGYLEGDGNSYINTGIIPTTNTKVVVDSYMLLSDMQNGPALFGATDTFLYYTFQTTASWMYVGKINGKHSVGQAGYYFSGRHTITIDLSDMTNIVNIDGTNYGTFTGTQATDVNPIYLWNAFDSWGELTHSDCTAKIYSFKIYESNVLTMDLIPVLDSEGTPCLYDLVTETFFYNQGTGEFSYGIEEDEYSENHTPIKYIETNGTQYIDTGVVPTDNTDIDMVASAVEGTTYKLDYFESSSGFNYLIPIHVDSFNSVITNYSDVTVRLDCYTESLEWWGIVNIASGETVDFNASYENCKHICICFQDTDIVKLNEYTFMLNNLTDSFTSNYLEDLPTCSLYLMNGLIIDTTYKYKEIDTTVEPNLTASDGATLTLGSTYMAYLTEDEIEQAVDNGWTIQ